LPRSPIKASKNGPRQQFGAIGRFLLALSATLTILAVLFGWL
jgi:hypothetical protein